MKLKIERTLWYIYNYITRCSICGGLPNRSFKKTHLHKQKKQKKKVGEGRGNNNQYIIKMKILILKYFVDFLINQSIVRNKVIRHCFFNSFFESVEGFSMILAKYYNDIMICIDMYFWILGLIWKKGVATISHSKFLTGTKI